MLFSTIYGASGGSTTIRSMPFRLFLLYPHYPPPYYYG